MSPNFKGLVTSRPMFTISVSASPLLGVTSSVVALASHCWRGGGRVQALVAVEVEDGRLGEVGSAGP